MGAVSAVLNMKRGDRMINFKCSSCGGEMTVSSTGDLVCSYCGSKSVFTDKDLSDYKNFRYRMLAYLSAISDRSDPEETDMIWKNAEQEQFILADGRRLSINYLFKGKQDDVTIYTARRNVIFVFPKGDIYSAGRFQESTGRLDYPSADIKGLSEFFPLFSGSFEIAGGRTMLSVSKGEELYPLSAFGSLPPEHTAWIISRLENLCCVLAYSDIAHNGIDIESVFINARTHQAYLLGGWWNSSQAEGGSQNDLIMLRAAAKRLTGLNYERSPEQFKRFITEPPAENAFDDFALWDKVIEDGFKGRKFRKLDLLSNLNI